METMNPSELPATLSILPGYPNVFLTQRLWIFVLCQLFVCVTSSAWLSYYLTNKLYGLGSMSWKKAVELMGPISRRLNNLEKERAVWNCYMEWIEDYCSVYYGLLNYLNVAASDLDKICNEDICNFKDLTSDVPDESEARKENDGQFDEEVPCESDWDKMGENIDPIAPTNFDKILTNMKLARLENPCDGCDIDSKGFESLSGTSWGLNSTIEDLDSLKGTVEEAETSEVSH
ncbi:hypothetical protein RUM44_005942 [Polyplax serrata]|uniref:Uncharacterized protein n=1 Tax=Polyplax serrata TaxID=468196 RepID=A0ABR1AYJ5_POLSC